MSMEWIPRLTRLLGHPELAQLEYRWLQESVARRYAWDPLKAKLRLDLLLKWRVERRKPLSYLLGSQPFCGLDIGVRPPILIPRSETAEWTWALIEKLKRSPWIQFKQETPFKLKLVDLCSGSGCVGLALTFYLRQQFPIHTTQMDVNPSALTLSRINARRLGEEAQVSFQCMDMWDSGFMLPSHDLLVCNPPYVSDPEMLQLEPDVRWWEDEKALTGNSKSGNPDGLVYYRRLLHLLKTYHQIESGKEIGGAFCWIGDPLSVWKWSIESHSQDWIPQFVFEFGGSHQTNDLVDLFSPFCTHLQVLLDGNGRDRVLLGRM